MNLFLRIILLGLALLASGSFAELWAQTTPATSAILRGTVADSVSGLRLPGTGLQLQGPAGTTTTATDELGTFRFGGWRPAPTRCARRAWATAPAPKP